MAACPSRNSVHPMYSSSPDCETVIVSVPTTSPAEFLISWTNSLPGRFHRE